MVKTFGLTHISLAVCDLERSLHFYEQVFGATVSHRDATSILIQSPGSQDAIAFELDPVNAGKTGGIKHFGFRLISPADLDGVVAEVERYGGKILRQGEFAPGCPFVYAADPDGYKIEIWYE